MKLPDMKTHDEVLHEQLADPEFRDEWDGTAPARAVAGELEHQELPPGRHRAPREPSMYSRIKRALFLRGAIGG